MDTRNAAGPLGGPALEAGKQRVVPILSSACGLSSTASAYSLNFTVVPHGPLGFLTVWPNGTTQPLASTLNALTGAITANNAIIPSGTNGAIEVYATDVTDLVIDVNGYFTTNSGSTGLSFFGVTPCRGVDTRLASGPLGGPALARGQQRDFDLSTSQCGISAAAQGLSLNATVVPAGSLGFLSLWAKGGSQPLVSTLNALDGSIVSNGALLRATNGAISAFVTDPADVIFDINGYFAPAVILPPTITDFNPKSAPIGTLITVSGTNLQPFAGTAAQVTLAKQGGGAMAGVVSSTTPTSLTFVIPAGAATGPLSVTVNGASSPGTVTPLTIVPSSTYTLSALPASANLIQGQTTTYAVSMSSTSGFNQLAALSLSGVPNGVTASFKPQQISAGQTSILTLTAPAGQTTGTSTLTVSAAATVDGIPVSQSAAASLTVSPVTTSFVGRTVVSDALETPLANVTIRMLGKDGNGATTGCTGTTVSDAAGNFALTNLAANCIGPQLIGYDGLTVTSPPGKYAGVNLVYTLTAGQVTASPVLVHLPRIDDKETFNVAQNSGVDQELFVQIDSGSLGNDLPGDDIHNAGRIAAESVPVDGSAGPGGPFAGLQAAGANDDKRVHSGVPAGEC
jgi:hypothetical protein